MDRRQSLRHMGAWVMAAVAAGSTAGARAARRPGLPRIGWLQISATGPYAEVTSRGFLKGLREAGLEDGRNVEIIRRSAEGNLDRLRSLARDLVAADCDVVFAPAKPMADAMWFANKRLPTVIATVTDPVKVDYAVSLARPGKQITGVTTANAQLIGKRMQLLTELVPNLKRVGTFVDENLLASCGEELDLLEHAAARLGVTIVRVPVVASGAPVDIDDALMRAVAAKVQAVITVPMTTNLDMTAGLAGAATRHRMPFIHDVPQLAGEGLAVYGPDFEDIFRRAARYVARILAGEKPADMAIEEPTQFHLIVNAKAARALGLELPRAVLARADEVLP